MVPLLLWFIGVPGLVILLLLVLGVRPQGLFGR